VEVTGGEKGEGKDAITHYYLEKKERKKNIQKEELGIPLTINQKGEEGSGRGPGLKSEREGEKRCVKKGGDKVTEGRKAEFAPPAGIMEKDKKKPHGDFRSSSEEKEKKKRGGRMGG